MTGGTETQQPRVLKSIRWGNDEIAAYNQRKTLGKETTHRRFAPAVRGTSAVFDCSENANELAALLKAGETPAT